MSQTLPRNLEEAVGIPDVEFVIFNYGSADNLQSWVVSNLAREIGKRVVYAELVEDAPEFRRSHAKNCASLLSTGDVVVNLDADNFVSNAYIRFLLDAFQSGYSMVIGGANSYARVGETTGGRIALARSTFLEVGGYDEEFVGYGHEHSDLRERASRLGCRVLTTPPEFLLALQDDDITTKCKFHAVPYAKSLDQNFKRMKQSVFSNRLVANQDRRLGMARIVRNFEGDPVTVGYP